MARVVDMPKLSPTMEEGQIVTWHKKEGEFVEVDELLAEVETDKATMEFRSFDRGTLLKILAPPGSMVRLGEPVAVIGNAGESADEFLGKGTTAAVRAEAPVTTPAPPPAPPPAAAAARVADRVAPAQAVTAPPQVVAAPATTHDIVGSSIGPDGRVKASPYVRKLARERGIDLRRMSGSGTFGRIVARDLSTAPTALPALSTTTTTAAPAPSRTGRRESTVKPLSMMRRTIARRLTESKQQVPHFYLTIDVDAEPLVDLRSRFNTEVGRKISFNDLVVKAVAVAIARAPEVNAQFTAEALVYHGRIDISVAVAVDDGLVTPVVRDADQKSLLQISAEIQALSLRARDRKLSVEEMTGGTFSISNLGMHGIDEFAAVINPPEGAILAVGAIRSEPVVKNDTVVPGKRMKLTLSCDHRVVDGAVGAKFLAELRKVLEQPLQILAL